MRLNEEFIVLKIDKLLKDINCFSQKDVNQNKFIMTIRHDEDNRIIMRFEYIILGNYSTEKNTWAWMGISNIMNKKMIEYSENIRKSLMKKNDIFVRDNISVLPTRDLFDKLLEFEKILGKNILTQYDGYILSVYVIDKMIINNIIS